MSTEQDLIAMRGRVAELENRVRYLYKKLNIEYVESPSTANSKIVELLKKGNKIEAIKIYMELYNVGLAEAKKQVDGIEASLGL